MPTPPEPKITAWSYSRWSHYKGCPRQAKYRHVEQRPEPPVGPAATRGGEIHDIAEAYLKAKRRPKMPTDLETFTDEFLELRKLRATAEGQWAFTKSWAKSTGWFDRNVWVRVKIDAYAVTGPHSARVIDYKTGKMKDEHDNQLSLYALASFVRDPKLDNISAELWYLDHGVLVDMVYDRAVYYEPLRANWAKKTKAMLADRQFVPTPGPACYFCPWSAKKGGPCEFGD